MCACELHAPICRSSQAVWHYVNGHFCLLLCEESKAVVCGQKESREEEIRGGREK